MAEADAPGIPQPLDHVPALRAGAHAVPDVLLRGHDERRVVIVTEGAQPIRSLPCRVNAAPRAATRRETSIFSRSITASAMRAMKTVLESSDCDVKSLREALRIAPTHLRLDVRPRPGTGSRGRPGHRQPSLVGSLVQSGLDGRRVVLHRDGLRRHRVRLAVQARGATQLEKRQAQEQKWMALQEPSPARAIAGSAPGRTGMAARMAPTTAGVNATRTAPGRIRTGRRSRRWRDRTCRCRHWAYRL